MTANNGDITHTDLEAFIALGSPIPIDATTTLDEDAADAICDSINGEVNLLLDRLGISTPVSASSSPNSCEWLKLTKQLGATSLYLDGLTAQNSEDENERANRYWERYTARLQELWSSGGEILADADTVTDPAPSRVPVVVSASTSASRKRHLRFPQRAAADQYDDELAISRTGAGWRSAIRGW